jgi:2-polyprenyl-3-methyl-5-hydroxy-6-metoxy-1,4-benzoquinol methylase
VVRRFIHKTLERISKVFILDEIERRLDRIDANLLDLKTLSLQVNKQEFMVKTEHRFAFKSQDFINPKGSKNDFTRSPAFVGDVNRIFGRSVSYLDIGCANGGLVNDFLIQGNTAIGIEGSDFGLLTKQDHWKVIPQYLFNADVTKPFRVLRDSQLFKFDVIGAWEVLEHISESDLPAFLQNVRDHLDETSIFMASIAQFSDFDPVTGKEWHVTIKPKEWWYDLFIQCGLKPLEVPRNFAFPRGTGNSTVWDWDTKVNPNSGFHVFLKQI